MATWKKVLREDYAVGTTDGIINFDSVAATGSAGNIALRLYDTRDAVGNLSDGAGLELVYINAGTGISIESGGAIGLTNSGFTVSDGTNSSPIDLGDTLTIQGGGDITVTESAGTVTVSYTAAAQQAVGYTFSDGTNTEAITATNSNPTIQWTGGTFIDVDYTPATNTFEVDLNSQYNHITVTDGTNSQDITLGGTIQIQGTGDISVSQTGGTFTIDYTDANPPNVFSTIAVSGQSNVVADSSTDTLTLVGSGVNITTNATSDTITFTVPDLTIEDDGNSSTYYITFSDNTAAGQTFNPIASMSGDLKWVTDGTGAGTLEVGGNLTVAGTTTTLQTQNVIVEDKLITLANPDTGNGDTTSANGGGIEIKSGDPASVDYPSLLWSSTANLSGWTIQNHAATNNTAVAKEISTMQFAAASAPTTEQKGDFYYDTTNDLLYVCLGA